MLSNNNKELGWAIYELVLYGSYDVVKLRVLKLKNELVKR